MKKENPLTQMLRAVEAIDFNNPAVRQKLKDKGIKVSTLTKKPKSVYAGKMAYRDFPGDHVEVLGGGVYDLATDTTIIVAEIRGHQGRGKAMQFRVKPLHRTGDGSKMKTETWKRTDASPYRPEDRELGDTVFFVFQEHPRRKPRIRQGLVSHVYKDGLKLRVQSHGEEIRIWKHAAYSDPQEIKNVRVENEVLKTYVPKTKQFKLTPTETDGFQDEWADVI